MSDLLSRLSEDFALSTGGDSLSIDSLRHRAMELRREFERARGCSVAIHGRPRHVVECAIALDGIAAELLVVPHDACKRFVERLVDARPNLLVLRDPSVSDGLWPRSLDRPWSDSKIEIRSIQNSKGPSTRWLITTSGTTSRPKLVAHSLYSLSRSVSRKRQFGVPVWGSLYDLARFAGLQVALQAMIGGGMLVAPDRGMSLSKQVEVFLRAGTNALSATPTLWRKLLMTPGVPDLPLKQITLGGEIADQRTLNALRSNFPNANITHIYASTEAGTGFAVHDGLAGFPAAWLGSNRNGVELAISDRSTLLIRPEVREQTCVGSDTELFSEQGWLDTGDLVSRDKARIFFQGRENGSINVGGNKVMPEEIEARIESLDFVRAVLVRARKSSVSGSLLEALIVIEPEGPAQSDMSRLVKKCCRDSLAAYKVPSFVRVVDELPVTAAGKLARGS